MNSGRTRPLLEALLAAAGMVLFALFVRSGLPWSLVSDLGLAMAALAVLLSLRRERTMAGLLGLVPFGRRAALMGLLGAALGFAFGLLFRWKFGLHWFPGALGRFAPAAAAIGGVEELLYRGYVQGRLNRINGVLGVIGAAAAHTAYKIALFLPPALGLSSGLPAGGRVDWLRPGVLDVFRRAVVRRVEAGRAERRPGARGARRLRRRRVRRTCPRTVVGVKNKLLLPP